MKKEVFDKQFAEVAATHPEFAAEVTKVIEDNAVKAKSIEVLEAENGELASSNEALEAEIAELKKDPSADKIVKGTIQIGNKTFGFQKGHKSFNYKGVVYMSEEAIKDKALMTELVKMGYGGLEVVK